MKKVLSTKTLGHDALAYAHTLNLAVKCIDFIETTALPFTFGNITATSFNAIAFTSANAVNFFFENSNAIALTQGKAIFALQGKTTDELAAHGLSPTITASSAAELADAIINAKFTGTVLHVCGNLRLPVLEDRLKEADIAYQPLTVYQTISKAEKLAENFDAILFYSPSGVDGFLAQNDIADNTVCCCIGSTTAGALKARKISANIILPVDPSPIFMLSAIAKHYNTN